MPLCADCRAEAEYETTGDSRWITFSLIPSLFSDSDHSPSGLETGETCSRCGAAAAADD